MSWITPTSQALGLAAQNKLLKHFVKTPFEVKSTSSLNYVEIKKSTAYKKDEKVLILMHGYASGLGFFFDNYDALATHFDRIIAVDWLGMGLSNRTVKPVTTLSIFNAFCTSKNDSILEVTQKVTNEFVDSLEELRVAENIPRFVLAGHSLGGYLSARYALKYPKAVEALVLISPAGIEPLPPVEMQVDASQLDWKMRIIDNLWKMNFTPQNIVRILGPRGPGVVTSGINRRFSSRWEGENLTAISDYLYHISAAPGNGEYALNALLQPKFLKSIDDVATTNTTTDNVKPPAGSQKVNRYRSGVYARLPLETDMCQLKMPVLLLYGDNDWLSYPSVADSVKLWQRNGVNAELAIISNSGHHLYTDNSIDFNRTVIDWAKRSAYLTSDSTTTSSRSSGSSRSQSIRDGSIKKTNLIDIL